jgi:hypothetical protein
MGYGSDVLFRYMDWQQAGLLKRGDGVLDLGAQELVCVSADEINRFVTLFGGDPFSEGDAKRVADGGFAGEALSRAGFRYTAIDYKVYPFAIRMDLNLDQLAPEHHARYKLVTNHGTSEHILNQWNVFKTMHDAAEEGGLLYHCVPFSGMFEHGVVNYNAKFWWALSEANAYRIMKMWTWVSADGPEPVPDTFLSQIDGIGPLRASSSTISVVFQKTTNRPFAGLIDPAFR